MDHLTLHQRVGTSVFEGCTCTPGYWMSTAQGEDAALDLLHGTTEVQRVAECGRD